MKSIKSFLYYWFPWVGYMMIIFYFSSKTGSEVSLPTPDYVAHFLEYSGLGFLSARVIAHSRPDWKKGYIYFGAVLFSMMYALSDEFHQSFVPGRSTSLSDLIADTLGATLGQLVWWLWERFKLRWKSIRLVD